MLKHFILLFFIISDLPAITRLGVKQGNSVSNNGILKLTFVNVVDTAPMVLRSVNYINPFGETYSINKFKYYISNITLRSSEISFAEKDSYHLINQSDPASLSFTFPMPPGNYTSLSFLIGVDSLHNVSGAQTDALDPVNDMFWTWNSGYVMAKMEGKSPVSSFNNVFEFHLGGFAGPNSVLKTINIALSPKKLEIRADKSSEIIVEGDANTWWQNPNEIRIASSPNITSPGAAAKKVSDNYRKMFTIKQIISNW